MPQSPYDAFQRTASRRPDLVLMLAPASAGLPYAPQGFRVTYGEAMTAVRTLRQEFATAGYGLGSRVALILENRPEFFYHWLALNAVGASIVPINPDLRPEELLHQMCVADPDLILYLPAHHDLVAAGTPAGLARVQVGQPIPLAQRPRPAANGDQGGGGATECALLFTSGSTGKPKGCMLSNHYFINMAGWYTNLGGIGQMTPDAEIALTPLPFFHMNALGCNAVGMMLIGGAFVPLDRFSARRWWATVSDSGATILHNLGVIPAILLQLPEDEAEHRHSARFNFSPGVDAQHKIQFEARFRLPIVEGWAMTETGGAAVTCTAGHDYPDGLRCIGAARTGMEWRVVDDAGRDLARGKPGELWVRAAGDDPRHGFFSGYTGDPDATEEAWQGGWFHTGDIVSVDGDGLFYFVDRKKSIIRRSGENISALEVEAALKDCAGIRAVAATPVTDTLRGEEVFVFLVTDGPQDQAQLLESILADASGRLSYHKLPGWVAFVPELPLSSTQKLLRGQLKSEAATAITEGRAIDLRDRKGSFRAPLKASKG